MLHNELKDISNRIDVLNKEIDELTGGAVYMRLMQIDNEIPFSWKAMEKYLSEKREMKDDIFLLAGIKVAFKHLENDMNKYNLGSNLAQEAKKNNSIVIKGIGHGYSFFANGYLENVNSRLDLMKECMSEIEGRQNSLQHGILSLMHKIGFK